MRSVASGFSHSALEIESRVPDRQRWMGLHVSRGGGETAGRPFNRTTMESATWLIYNSLIRIKRWNDFLAQSASVGFHRNEEKMAKGTVSKGSQGPAIRAVEPWGSSAGRMHQLLTDDERARLAVVASIVRFKKGAVIYREGERVDAIFNIIGGVFTPYRTAPDGSEYIGAFLFAEDLFGLSEEGRYINSMRAITPVTAYRNPVSALRSRFSKDAQLEFRVICKLCQELRLAQRHAFLLSLEKSNHQACDVFACDVFAND